MPVPKLIIKGGAISTIDFKAKTPTSSSIGSFEDS